VDDDRDVVRHDREVGLEALAHALEELEDPDDVLGVGEVVAGGEVG
jgi:hypothetical protein